MSENIKKSLNYESKKGKFDKTVIATKFLSKVLENAIKQSLLAEQRLKKEVKNSTISEKKALHILNDASLMVPIEATLDTSYMMCCLS